MEARLQESIEKLQKEKEELTSKLTEMDEQSKKDKALVEQMDGLKNQVSDLEDRLSMLKTSRDECILIYICTGLLFRCFDVLTF